MEEWTFVTENILGESPSSPHSTVDSHPEDFPDEISPLNDSLGKIIPNVYVDVPESVADNDVIKTERKPPPYPPYINLLIIGSSFAIFWLTYQNFYY